MRIISGKYRGKRLIAPKNLPVRPTTDMAKEGLFNILNNRYYFNEISVLDLFSGTGNIAYEFASRGTKDITAVDIHQACIRYINDTQKNLGADIKTVKSEVIHFLTNTHKSYDIIFADPPYDFSEEQLLAIVNSVFEHQLLSDNGSLIIEHAKHTKFPEHRHLVEQRKYGSSMFSFFTYHQEGK